MHEYLTFDDNTTVTHSEIFTENGIEKVKVYIEKPVDWGFNSAWFMLPDYQIKEVKGFSPDELKYWVEFLKKNAHTIFKFASLGGFKAIQNS
jgi:hypothetical protein